MEELFATQVMDQGLEFWHKQGYRFAVRHHSQGVTQYEQLQQSFDAHCCEGVHGELTLWVKARMFRVLMRKSLFTPGWSKSWTMAAHQTNGQMVLQLQHCADMSC